MVFRFQAQDGTSLLWPEVETIEKFFMLITECLQRAGEVVPNKTEEIHDNKFGDLIKNKTVHFLALFIMVYVGVGVTIGGIITHLLHNCLTIFGLTRVDRDILDDRSWRWALVWVCFNWILWW